MCESNHGGWLARASAFFSTPTLAKGTPGYLVSGFHLFGITMSDMITAVTLIYTLVLLVGAIPGIWKTWDFFKSRRAAKKQEEKEE